MSASAVSITSSPARSTKGAGAEIRAAETPSARPIRICRGAGWAGRGYRKGRSRSTQRRGGRGRGGRGSRCYSCDWPRRHVISTSIARSRPAPRGGAGQRSAPVLPVGAPCRRVILVGRGGASSVRRSFVPSRPAARGGADQRSAFPCLRVLHATRHCAISPRCAGRCRPEVGVPLPARHPRNAALCDLAPLRGAVPAPTGRTGQRSGFPAQQRHPDEGQLHGHQSCVEKRSKGCSLYQKTSMISKSPPG